MSVRPIIFSGPMVRALIEGRKTQTRRLLRVAPQDWARAVEMAPYHGDGGPYGKPGELVQRTLDNARMAGCGKAPCLPGDLLYVREAFYLTDDGESEFAVFAEDDAAVKRHREAMDALPATFPSAVKAEHLKLRPSIHMPRWASRLTLKVTDVRVERLQDISEEDAIAEGVNGGCIKCGEEQPCACTYPKPDHRDAFCWLWNHLNEGRGFGWNANPWVVAITFEVHKQNVDEFLKHRESA